MKTLRSKFKGVVGDIEVQLSELFAYPNVEIFGVGRRSLDNRGWTVVVNH